MLWETENRHRRQRIAIEDRKLPELSGSMPIDKTVYM